MLGVLKNPKLSKSLVVLVLILILLFGQGKAQKKTVDLEYVNKNCHGSPAIGYGGYGQQQTTCFYEEKNYYSADQPDACCKVKTRSPNGTITTETGYCRPFGNVGFTGLCRPCPKEGEKCEGAGCCAVTSNSENILVCPPTGAFERSYCKREINPEPFPEKCYSKEFCSKYICSNPEFEQVDCGKDGECLCPIGIKSEKDCRRVNETDERVPSVPKNYIVDTVLQCKTQGTKTKRGRAYYTFIGLDKNKIGFGIKEEEAKCSEICGKNSKQAKYVGISGDSYCFCEGFINKNGCQKAPSDSKCSGILAKDPRSFQHLICPVPNSTKNICTVVYNPKCGASGESCNFDGKCCSGCCYKDDTCASIFKCLTVYIFGG